MERASPDGMIDFKGTFYAARCVIQHSDPYKDGEPLRAYLAEQNDHSLPSDVLRQALSQNIYLPTTFIFIAPFALLPWALGHLLWMILSAGSLLLAAFLMWNRGSKYSPLISGTLICFLLANCEAVLATGNPAGLVVGLCVVAVWCLIEERFVPAGIVCLAVALAIKPHDAGLVWLYFLLAGVPHRRRALQTLLITVVLVLSAFLWVSHVAPYWMQDWHSNLSAISAPGGINDPRPASVTGNIAGMVIDLQAAISVFWDLPRIYNPASYLICGALLLAWTIRTLRSRFSRRGAWLALAAVVPLTMLVTYHRPYDAKLLMLTIPACAILWAEGGPIRWIALAVNTAGLVLTGDIPLAVLGILANNLHVSTAGIYGKVLTVLLMRPASLILLVMGVFYLWEYLRRAQETGCGLAQTTPERSQSALKLD